MKAVGLRLPSAVPSSLTLVSPLRKRRSRVCREQATVTVKERQTSSGTETDSLIRRHPKIFFVSFEHRAQHIQTPLFQREGREGFNRCLLRVGLQSRGGNRIRSHKQASLFSTGESRNSAFTTNRKN